MDTLLTHFQEIKIIGMLALGIFCYQKLKKMHNEPSELEFSESQIDETYESQEKVNEEPNANEVQPEGNVCQQQLVSKVEEAQQCYEQIIEDKVLATAFEQEKSNTTGSPQLKTKTIRKVSKNKKRPILRSHPCLQKNQAKQTEVMIA